MAEQTPVADKAHAKTHKATRVGVVIKAAMDKTITVKIDRLVRHKMYKKTLRRNTKYLAHDERGSAGVGDVVKIIECRPLSKLKSWRLLEVISKAK